MKRGLTSILLFISIHSFSQDTLNLVPWPAEVKQSNGFYRIPATSKIYCDLPGKENVMHIGYLGEELRKRGIVFTIAENEWDADILLLMRRMPTGGKPAYRLLVNEKGIRIESNFDAPGFHGIQTLLQLLPTHNTAGNAVQVPFVEIFDHARFHYRGMHLDVSRHFFPVSFVKKYIDYLAYHKLNTLHWHLTEDQGWRVEIKKYPALTTVGAWRNGTIIGRYPGQGNDNIRYGGYYTQDEIREVVQYAAERFIDIIPEFDMPGHTGAAIAAYPYLSCFPDKPTFIPPNMISAQSIREQKAGRVKLVQETWGIFDDVFCAGNDSTFKFIEGVLDEMTGLFPSKYFHVGGDECPKTHWKACPKCQKRIKTLGLKDEHELQSYFIQRVEKYLNQKGKTLIGWDEILEGGLAPNAVVMSWRGEKGGIEAAKQKHFVIMSPQNPVYFDHTQSELEDSVTFGGFNPIEKVYAWDPIPRELSAEESKYIMGAQANVWTEYIKNEKKVEYTIFPRMAALSEVLWTPAEKKNWESFVSRLPAQLRRYESWGANYSTAWFTLRGRSVPAPQQKGIYWIIETRDPSPLSLGVFGKKEGSQKTELVKITTRKNDSVLITEPGDYFAEARKDETGLPGWENKQVVYTLKQSFVFNQATGRKILLREEPSPAYPGNGAFTLVDGIVNEKGFSRSREFLGWSGKDCDAVIDLGDTREISFVTIHALKRRSSWIWEPASAEVFASSDGVKWHSLKSTTDHTEKENQKITMTLAFRKTPARFIKIVVKNYGKIPSGNPGAGRDAWLFVDEIEVE